CKPVICPNFRQISFGGIGLLAVVERRFYAPQCVRGRICGEKINFFEKILSVSGKAVTLQSQLRK
ncbi:MAG: hypothetical protein J6Y87_07460, partial [Muribaculaceae bacterium]|nr:hypothetical protein [Muribaculaceae bacterium]